MIKELPISLFENYLFLTNGLCSDCKAYYNGTTNQHYFKCYNWICYFIVKDDRIQTHREDGKADNFNGYWLNGKIFSCEEFAKQTKHLICLNCKRFCNQNCFE